MTGPRRINMVDLHQYIGRHIAEGRADCEPCLDPRGLSLLDPKRSGAIALTLPDDGEHVPGKVFLKAVYE